MASKTYPKMDRGNRAKQFMPFDALKGFREALREKERIIVPKRELSKEQKNELDYKLHQIHKMDIVTVEYFQNGEYYDKDLRKLTMATDTLPHHRRGAWRSRPRHGRG